MKTICDSCLAQSPVNGVHLTHCGHVLFKEEKPDIVVFARQQLAERDKAIARAAFRAARQLSYNYDRPVFGNHAYETKQTYSDFESYYNQEFKKLVGEKWIS